MLKEHIMSQSLPSLTIEADTHDTRIYLESDGTEIYLDATGWITTEQAQLIINFIQANTPPQ